MIKIVSSSTKSRRWTTVKHTMIVVNALLLLTILIYFRIESANRARTEVLPSSKIGQVLNTSVDWAEKYPSVEGAR